MKNRKLFTLLLFCCMYFLAQSQSSAWLWGKYGFGYNIGIGTDAVGYIYSVGFFSSSTTVFGNDTLQSGTGQGVYLVKYDSLGNVIWAQSVAEGGSVSPQGMTTDLEGNTYISGESYSNQIIMGSDTFSSAGEDDIILCKYNSSGNLVWAKHVGGAGYDYGGPITTDAAGNVIVVMNISSLGLVVGNDTITNINNIFVAKYDSSGQLLWLHKATDNVPIFINAICTDAAGNIFITGGLQGDSIKLGNLTFYNPYYSDTNFDNYMYLTIKYDANLNVLWTQSAIGEGFYGLGGSALETDAAGSLYVTGGLDDTVSFFSGDTFRNYNPRVFLAKYDSAGNFIWVAAAGASSDCYPAGLSLDKTGDIYLIGRYTPGTTFGNYTLPAYGSESIFLTEYDNAGNVIRVASNGGTGNDNIAGVNVSPLGDVYVSGTINSPSIAFGNDSLVSFSGGNSFLARLGNIAAGVNILSQANGLIRVFPNPSNSNFYFEGVQAGYTLEVYDVLGQLIHSSTIGNDNYALNLGGNARGIYFYRIAEKSTLVQQGKIVLN